MEWEDFPEAQEWQENRWKFSRLWMRGHEKESISNDEEKADVTRQEGVDTMGNTIDSGRKDCGEI